jgi:hypothetical protein
MSEKIFDIYAKYSVKAASEEDAIDKWDAGEAVFQEFEAIIEVL